MRKQKTGRGGCAKEKRARRGRHNQSRQWGHSLELALLLRPELQAHGGHALLPAEGLVGHGHLGGESRREGEPKEEKEERVTRSGVPYFRDP